MASIVASDVVLHTKQGDDEQEEIVFPVTRYANIISSPKAVAAVSDSIGAPFMLLISDYDTIDEELMFNIVGAGITG